MIRWARRACNRLIHPHRKTIAADNAYRHDGPDHSNDDCENNKFRSPSHGGDLCRPDTDIARRVLHGGGPHLRNCLILGPRHETLQVLFGIRACFGCIQALCTRKKTSVCGLVGESLAIALSQAPEATRIRCELDFDRKTLSKNLMPIQHWSLDRWQQGLNPRQQRVHEAGGVEARANEGLVQIDLRFDAWPAPRIFQRSTIRVHSRQYESSGCRRGQLCVRVVLRACSGT